MLTNTYTSSPPFVVITSGNDSSAGIYRRFLAFEGWYDAPETAAEAKHRNMTVRDSYGRAWL